MSNTDSDGDPAATTEHPAFGALPAPRMEPYLNYVRGDQGRAIELYQWNIAVSAALWEVLCHVEVGLRHAIDSAMTIRHSALGRPDEWLDFAENTPEGAREIGTRAVDDITAAWENAQKNRRRGEGNHPFTMDHAIAELNFSFWRFLLAKDREPKLGKSIRKGFPHAPRRSPQNDMQDLRQLVVPLYAPRNRIAHHEPIWSYPRRLENRHDDALTLLGYISPELKSLAGKASRFRIVFDNHP